MRTILGRREPQIELIERSNLFGVAPIELIALIDLTELIYVADVQIEDFVWAEPHIELIDLIERIELIELISSAKVQIQLFEAIERLEQIACICSVPQIFDFIQTFWGKYTAHG